MFSEKNLDLEDQIGYFISVSAVAESPIVNRNRTKSMRAGITFPVGAIHRRLVKGKYANKIRETGSVYMSTILEYMVAELIELSGECAHQHKRKRIMPRHILLSVKQDHELSFLLKDVVMPQGGVSPHIEAVLLPQKSTKNKSVSMDSDSY